MIKKVNKKLKKKKYIYIILNVWHLYVIKNERKKKKKIISLLIGMPFSCGFIRCGL